MNAVLSARTQTLCCHGNRTGVGELDQLLSSEDEDDEDEMTPSTSAAGCRTVTMATQRKEAESQQSSR